MNEEWMAQIDGARRSSWIMRKCDSVITTDSSVYTDPMGPRLGRSGLLQSSPTNLVPGLVPA